MSKKAAKGAKPPPPATKRASKFITNLTDKNVRIIAMCFHGYELPQIGANQLKLLKEGPHKKILSLYLPELIGEVAEADAMKMFVIQNAVTEIIQQVETDWDKIPVNLPNDLSKYWSAGKMNEDSDTGNYSSKSTEISNTQADAEYEYTGEEMEMDEEMGMGEEEVDTITLTRKTIQMVPKRIAAEDLPLMYDELLKFPDLDKSISDYIIIMVGDFTTEFLVRLMKVIPLAVVVHFAPVPLEDLPFTYATVNDDLEAFKQSADTKPIGLFVDVITISSMEYFKEDTAKEFYNQFIDYIYDVEMLMIQFKIYEADFVEINDQHELTLDPVPTPPTKEDSDDTAVGVYLDNLCNSIAVKSNSDRRQSFLHMSPFLLNDYDKIIVEDANVLIQNAIATEMHMVTYWRIVEIMINVPQNIATDCIDCQYGETHFPEFYEIMSWEAFVQMLQNIRRDYDQCSCFDIDEKCAIYILRRTLHKILQVNKTFTLSTKLCMRDFIYYITPRLGSVIRRFMRDVEVAKQLRLYAISRSSYMSAKVIHNAIKETPKFYGLSFSDTYQKLTCKEKTYRFENGYIRCTTENWLYEPWKRTIELKVFGCLLYAHRSQNSVDYVPRIRIVTSSQTTCTLVMKNEDEMELFVQWPNDCQVHYISWNGMHVIEQLYYWKKISIFKRVYIQNGVMLVYLMNDQIRVLTAYGVVYNLYPEKYVYEDTADSDPKPPPNLDLSEEISFVKNLSSYGVYCEHFDVTRCDGRRLRVLNGILVEEIAHYLIYEWMEYREGKSYAEREDGIKMIWSYDSFKILYPCGAVFTMTVDESTTSIRFGCRSKSTEDILRKMNPALIEKVAQRGHTEGKFVSYSINYQMQHKNLANVEFHSSDRVALVCPEGLRIIVRQSHLVVIEVDNKVSFRINPGLCTILSNLPVVEEKELEDGERGYYEEQRSYSQWLCKLFLNHNATTIISFRNYFSVVTLFSDGEMTAEAVNPEGPLVPVEIEKYFLTKSFKFVMAFMDLDEYNKYMNSANKTYFYTSDAKTVILRALYPIDEVFSMPIEGYDDMMTKFRSPCHNKQKTDKKPPEDQRRVFAARIIHKNTGPKIMDYREVLQNFPFNEQTLGDSMSEAMDVFFGEKIKSRHSPEWIERNAKIREDLAYKNATRSLYNAMIRLKVFPRYHEYKECEGNLRLLKTDKLQSRVNKARRKK